MSKFKNINDMLFNLYNERKYEDVINKVDRLLKLEIKNKNYENTFKFLRAKSLRYVGNFGEAIEELKYLCSLEEENNYFYSELFFIFYCIGKYREAFNMLPKLYLMNDKHISNHSLSIIELVIRRNLQLPMSYKNNERCEYLKSQIVYYDEELAFQHIKSHIDLEEGLHNIHSIFDEKINLRYLFECAKKDIKFSKKVNVNDVLESYIFSVPGIGYDGNNKCNYLKVVVCPGTKEIITMYPYAFVTDSDVKMLNCDLNILFNKDKKEKINSRIEKFNKKFNLK